MTFETTILATGKTTTGIEVPQGVLEALSGGKRPLVKVTINGATYRTAVGSMGGKAMIPVSAENRATTGVKAGDAVTVGVELDTEKREVELPEDFAAALAASPAARAAYGKLPPSQQKAHVTAILGAKAAETRQRRVEKAIAQLEQA